MAPWALAESLVRFREQLNALAPNRSKASDGTIGDQAHAARSSDHNPRWIAGANLVTAFDATHDPAGGLNCDKLATALQRARDSRVKYVIWDRRIMSGAAGPAPWVWRPYSGPSPHTEHVHLSVVADKRCRDGSPWMLPGLSGDGPATGPASLPTLKQGDNGPAVASLQRFLNAEPWSPPLPVLAPDGDYGAKTTAVVRAAQEQCGVTGPDAVGTPVGPRTKAAFWARGWRG